MYPSSRVCELFSISRETVRTWSREFSDFLSPTANPGENRQRFFTDADLAVFALVSDMKARGSLYDDIKVSLGAGQRADPPEIENILAPTERGRLVQLEKQIVMLHEELAKIQGDVQRKDAQIELLERQLADAQQEIQKLNREIGRLEVTKDD